jgi:hypothetical protein
MSPISKTGTIKSFVKKGRTYETTEVAEKHSDFPLTLPLSPDSGGEGGVRGDFRGAFSATFRLTLL